MKKRKNFLDNIRWISVILVIIYHIFYIFNCSGVVSNIGVQGIEWFDGYCVFVYPWIMCLLFVVSGVSARYSRAKRNNKDFLKDRVRRTLIPSLVGIFVYGWFNGYVTNYYNDIFMGEIVPGPIKYLVFSLIGIGVLWYLHIIFIGSILVVIIDKLDKKKWAERFFRYYNVLYLLLMIPVIWLSSMLLNMPLITVYRFGIYLLMFIFGYYVFSRDDIQDSLVKYRVPLCLIALVMSIIYVYTYYGHNYTDEEVLQNLFTNAYAWISILAIFGFSKKHLDFSNKYTKYMNKNNFGFYVFHYTIILLIGFILVTKFKLPFILNYIIIFISTCILLPLLVELIRKIPVLNKLLLGEGYNKKPV